MSNPATTQCCTHESSGLTSESGPQGAELSLESWRQGVQFVLHYLFVSPGNMAGADGLNDLREITAACARERQRLTRALGAVDVAMRRSPLTSCSVCGRSGDAHQVDQQRLRS